jgi:hypothetical protein
MIFFEHSSPTIKCHDDYTPLKMDKGLLLGHSTQAWQMNVIEWHMSSNCIVSDLKSDMKIQHQAED